jgi:hypothetical protein
MQDEDIEAKLDALAELARRMQAFAQANNLLLAAIVNNLANCAVNRHDYLAALFDDAGVRADSTSVDVQSQQTNYLAREEISKFFASVADGQERLDRRKGCLDLSPRAGGGARDRDKEQVRGLRRPRQ